MHNSEKPFTTKQALYNNASMLRPLCQSFTLVSPVKMAKYITKLFTDSPSV